jgi:hypothetical protein
MVEIFTLSFPSWLSKKVLLVVELDGGREDGGGEWKWMK